ncbi:MAG TPA: radical SAM family heme chaperone HemW [Thermoanaerobaculia bacterium]|nr:radical SAM family heme chaperone HemW [Thermoanaerobaculia bacterium]
MSEPQRPGIYLHVPFCSAVCPYCDFAVTVGGAAARERYVETLLAEMALVADTRDGALAAQADTVYFGGGTPTALDPEQLRRVLAGLGERLAVRLGEARIFLEANPEDVTPTAAAAWRALGVATLSLGVQSFDPAALAFLGRRHDPRRARESVATALAAGFDTVSLDLIYGLPGQDAAAWRRDLETAAALAPHHLSCYQLTVEPGTPFGKRRARGELAELPEAAQAERFRFTHRFLADAGYPAYEVSSFAATPAHRSRHNRKYWCHAPYLALGPSAHGFDGGRRRWWNEGRLRPWRRRVEAGEPPVAGGEVLDDAELALEALVLGLRTTAGIDLAGFRERHGIDLLATDGALVAQLEAAGLARTEGGPASARLALTLDGLAVADGIACRFELGIAPA